MLCVFRLKKSIMLSMIPIINIQKRLMKNQNTIKIEHNNGAKTSAKIIEINARNNDIINFPLVNRDNTFNIYNIAHN